MRRLSAIVLLLAVAALGSGALRYAHERAHFAGDAHEHTDDTHRDHDEPGPSAPHDESNCFTHAQLKLPMVGAGFVPVLVCVGLFVAFLTAVPVPVLSRRPILLFDSRGPPSR